MGRSADAKVCYGLATNEDVKLPWKCYCEDKCNCNDTHCNDPDVWWMYVNNYKNPYEYIWNNSYDNASKEDKEKWRNYRLEWEKNNPQPFKVVNHGHCDGEEEEILAIPGTVQSNDWFGTLDVNKFEIDPKEYSRFIEFLNKYNISFEPSDLKWYLVAYYG